ncbi:MAG: PAS domain S-box protein [Ferruginibacter sp.]
MIENDANSENDLSATAEKLVYNVIPGPAASKDLITTKALRILHLEDLPADALLVAKALKKAGFVFEELVVETRERFIDALKNFSPDVILADHSLPSFNSAEALEIFQGTGLKIPFILLTAAMSEEFAVGILRKGAEDYILKDRLNRLPNAILSALEKFRLQKERQEYLNELIIREKRFHALVDNGADAVAILDAKGRPVYVSSSVKRILGYTEEELMNIDLFTISHPDDTAALGDVMQQVMANPGIAITGHTGRMLHKDGSWRWIEATVTNLLHDPAINGIVDNFRDVTERKIAEEKIIHANRLYAFISQVNQTIVYSRDEKTVFKDACEIAIVYGKFKAAWIGMFNTEKQLISLVESCGVGPRYNALFTNVHYGKDGPQYCVLKNEISFVSNDIQNDQQLSDWKKLAASVGIGSIMVLPIKKLGVIIGTFNLYATEAGFFNSKEISLLEETARNISFALDILEKERYKLLADEKLAISELSLKQAQAIAHLGSWELNYSTGMATLSDEQLTIFGLNIEEKIQSVESLLSFIHPEDLEYVLSMMEEAKTGLNNLNFYHRIARRDGAVRYLYTQTRPRLNNEGAPTGLHGVSWDMTETRKSERALRESESNLHAIFENTSEGFILTDNTGIVKSFNNKSKEIISLNTGKELSVGVSLFDFIHPSRKDHYNDVIKKVLSGETLRYDYPYTHLNGEIKWFDYRIDPVYVSGEITGLSITSTDITERKQGEQLLQRSESNLNAIIENTDAFIYSLDREFRYITFNSALRNMMKELYGVTIKPGYQVFDFITEFEPGRVQEWQDVYSRALNGDIIKFEKEFFADNNYSYTSFSIHPIWENKRVIGLSCFVHDITQEKKAEEETRFKANLLNTIGQAAIATDMLGKVNYWNKAAEVIYGWTNEEAIGKNIKDLILSHQTKDSGTHIIEELKSGHSWSGEYIVQRKDGKAFPVFVSDSPIYDHNKNVSGIIGISSDITEKKKLENHLDKVNQLARIGSWEIDVAKKSLFWSAITKHTHGVPEDFVPDLETVIGLYKEGHSRASISHALNEAVENGIAFDLELQIITPKGDERWVRANGEAEFVRNKCVRVYGSCQDIDKSKKAELEILKVYEEKNIILESIGDAFFAVDKSWIVTYWNNQAEKMLQTPKKKILGKNLWSVFTGQENSVSYQQYHLAILTRQLTCFKDYYTSLNKWFEINAYPSENGLSVFFKDITQQKKSEDEREKMTADLLQRNTVLEQFSYIISHNLRAPVANIMGLSYTLQKKDLNDILKEKVTASLSSSAIKLDEVIKDLNEILNVRQELNEHTQVVNFARLLHNIRLSIDSLIVSKEAIITADFSAVEEMLTIKSYLHSIFYNIISNSLKYSRADIPPVISIKTQLFNNKIVLSFKDNGLGIDLQKRGDEIFGLYKRFHANKAEGKGMGLYMVKAQVEMMGGKISVSSEVNNGTEFKIDFEIRQQQL